MPRKEKEGQDRQGRDDGEDSLDRQRGAQHPGGYQGGAPYDTHGKQRPGGIQRGSGPQGDYVQHHEMAFEPERRGPGDGYGGLPVNRYGGVQEFHPLKREARRDEPRGEFHGLGPKGYRRSAARIREEICHLLTDHPSVDPSMVEVEVDDDGVVHLSGHTRSRRMKRTAENLCDQVQGVRDVDNRIEIDR